MVIHVWLKMEIVALLLEPTILIVLALCKGSAEEPTYGRVSSLKVKLVKVEDVKNEGGEEDQDTKVEE